MGISYFNLTSLFAYCLVFKQNPLPLSIFRNFYIEHFVNKI